VLDRDGLGDVAPDTVVAELRDVAVAVLARVCDLAVGHGTFLSFYPRGGLLG